MKKIFILSLVTLFVLTSCWGTDKNQENDIKNELLNWWNNNNLVVDNNSGKVEIDENRENFDKKSENYLEVNYLTEEKFLEFDNFTISDFKNLEKEITWKTLANVDKIVVSFSNKESTFPNDSFQLKQFKAWDSKFLYRAFKKYETLDYGENIYVFEAYSWDKVSKLQLIINILKPEQKVLEPVEVWNLPFSSTYWNPVEIWNWNITYSDIKWIEISQVWEIDLKNDSDSVTNYLKEKYNSVFYWNSKRTIWTNWLSFFVVRASGNNYIYEKHFYSWNLYWVLELEKWDLDSELTLDDKLKVISELNTTLKEKNDTFENAKIADKLFADLTN